MAATTDSPDSSRAAGGAGPLGSWRRLLTMLLALVVFLGVACALPYWFVSSIYPANSLPGWLGAPLPEAATDVAIFMSPLPRDDRSVYVRFDLPAEQFADFLDVVCARSIPTRQGDYTRFVELPAGFVSAPTWWTPAETATYDFYHCRTPGDSTAYILADLTDSTRYTTWIIISFDS
ncbi:MAG: hypothetical protein JW910_12685 [Anaerolineae bacterium]|nr:hypothetical protein [Anaerolineae bacterium]